MQKTEGPFPENGKNPQNQRKYSGFSRFIQKVKRANAQIRKILFGAWFTFAPVIIDASRKQKEHANNWSLSSST